MGTKNNPGEFDCYEKAEPDEPMFILLGRDPGAYRLVRRWARWAQREGKDPKKIREAYDCARTMQKWFFDHRDPGTPPDEVVSSSSDEQTKETE